MPKGDSRKSVLAAYLARTQPARIGPQEWNQIKQALEPISDAYLRRLLLDSRIALDPFIEGVRQDSFENLERTLLQLQSAYESGDVARKRSYRDLVIRAKDHAKFALEKKPEKQEMLLWMLTWLENPPAFHLWLGLRKRQGPLPISEVR